ncbi:FAD/NAD(P)-binding oxidoreductase [Moorella naiadis]|uniref:NAD(P)/FAD-dependent oxidoreductase n=1 Tax=Moorella naiadis (nom. illeg.) TaxID=3093670 RepID=UPI003D9CAE30
MGNIECVVVGAGPAGLGAAIAAARAGVRVLVLDENHLPGGQLFKQIHKFFGSKEHFAGTRGFIIGRRLLAEAESLGVEVWLNTRVWGLFNGNELAIIREGKTQTLRARKIILATGATENALAFPGCTLPGVMTAGAAQTMVNLHRVLPGKRVLMIGSGNVGLIVSYQLLQAGAEVVGIIEVASGIGGYAVHAAKLHRAGVPFYLGHTIVAARGKEGVIEALISPAGAGREDIQTLKVDTICLAVGLAPRLELVRLAGGRVVYLPDLGGHVPVHNSKMAITRDIYVAGDVAGVEEASTALEEGRLAGVAVAADLGYLRPGEAEAQLMEIKSGLAKLRSGPFGIKRQQAKEMLLKSGNCQW